jgi:ribonuclease P protein component
LHAGDLVVASASLLLPLRSSSHRSLVAVNCSYPKSRRLRKRADYLAVQRGGKTQHSRYFVVVCERNKPLILERDDSHPKETPRGRLGITVSKKVGNAVIRNRVKRVVREFARTSARWVPSNVDAVVIAKREAATATTAHLWAALEACRAGLHKESARC